MARQKATHAVFDLVVAPLNPTFPHPFPLDMLRRDSCVPATESMANLIKQVLDHDKLEWTPHIHLKRFYPVGGNPDPTFGRWESFGWRVLSVHEAEQWFRANGGPQFVPQFGYSL